MLKVEYHRNLPHFQRLGLCFFITCNLKGALPAEVIYQLKRERDSAVKKLEDDPLEVALDAIQQARKKYLARIDSILDACQYGPTWLKEQLIGEMTSSELRRLDGTHCTVLAACVMANHVHLIVDLATQLDRLEPGDEPNDTNYVQLYRILQQFKGRTAFQANRLLKRQGTFWQSESFDHYVRNEASLQRFIWYVLNNPVKAGLVEHWRNWPFQYVHPNYVPEE